MVSGSVSEEGLFLALDVGGTNFRVLLLELHEGNLVREEVKHYHISDELKLGCGLKLFDFLASCIADFVKEFNVADKTIPMGKMVIVWLKLWHLYTPYDLKKYVAF